MLKAFFLTIFFLGLAYWQTKPLFKKKLWKEITVYFFLLSLGALYSYGIIFDLSLPNPTLILTDLFKPIYEYIFNNLLA